MRSGPAAQSHAEPLLQVRDLSIDLVRSRNTAVSVVSEASFEIPRASIVALFGESGGGKTTLAMAVPRLLDERRYRVRGCVRLNGRNLIDLPERELERIRGAGIGFVFQDPGLALNPVLRIGRQVAEALRSGPPAPPGDSGVEAALDLAGLPDSARIAHAYPHQLSGGERQRVLIALALARRPALALADEPFSALDAPRALALCGLFDSIRRDLGTSFLIIGHNPRQLGRIADSALVMYGGQIVERGSFGELIETPLHPYTAALMRLSTRSGDAIPGNPPGLSERPRGCPFEPRCREREARCASGRPPEVFPEKGRAVRCFKYAC